MIIVGAKGHAKEVLQIIEESNVSSKTIYFFDDASSDKEDTLFNKFPIIRSIDKVNDYLQDDKRVILGTGSPTIRYKLAQKFIAKGGVLTSIIASSAIIGKYEVDMGGGVNIMHNTLITNQICIGEGSLINAYVSIHHNVVIGKYCEIAPGARLLGNCCTGDFCMVGAGAVLLPSVKIGANVVIGAGAVVTEDIPDNSVAIGIPARVVRKQTLLNLH